MASDVAANLFQVCSIFLLFCVIMVSLCCAVDKRNENIKMELRLVEYVSILFEYFLVVAFNFASLCSYSFSGLLLPNVEQFLGAFDVLI